MQQLPAVRIRHLLIAALAVAGACSDSTEPGAPGPGWVPRYTLQDLTPLFGDSLQPYKMNAAGQFLALRWKPGELPSGGGYLWDSGALQPVPCNNISDLNDRGQVLCGGTTVWQAGSVQSLSLPDSAQYPYALGDSGFVAGYRKGCDADPAGFCVFADWNGQMRFFALGRGPCGEMLVPDTYSFQIAQATGDIVFSMYEGCLFGQGTFVIRRATGNMGGAGTAGHINAFGQFVGMTRDRGGLETAIYPHADTGATASAGNATWINDLGDIIGVIDSLPRLLRGGTRVSLKYPVADTAWTVITPLMIDDAGRILATAKHGTVPPPSPYASMYVLLTPITP